MKPYSRGASECVVNGGKEFPIQNLKPVLSEAEVSKIQNGFTGACKCKRNF
jgi:hypothetical protein